ncbi:hypothetical protein LLG96_00575 [bacterium]|nr:hypothetical protein [bacterium]
MIKNILKLLLIVLLIAVLLAGIAWLIFVRNYPWWVVLSVALGLAGLWFGILYIRKIIVRRKEKEFVQRVIRQNEEAIETAPIHEQQNLRALQDKWKESVDLVRNSYLRKKGNPLYVLPWYLMLGESGSGKTSAIKNSNLNSPITEVKRTAGISVTKNCDWWFFEEAIILDTAGRYTIPVEEGRDREEWEKFLTLLAKYRRREPINGIIVTIAADKLLEKDEALLSDEGQSVRRRIDQLMRTVGARIPVYVMVTKMDLVHGMVEFSNLLPDATVDQAMGFINQECSPEYNIVLDSAMSSISENLRNQLSILINQGNIPEPEIFLYTSGFDRIKQGLRYFVQGVFDENPYQETPLFRGLFFSSAIQEEKLRIDSKSFGVPDGGGSSNHSNGLFLKDFFKEILPNDRYLFTPIRELIQWRRVTRNTGLIAWFLLWACLCGLMSFSYINNRIALDVISNYKPPVMTANTADDIRSLYLMKSKLVELEEANNRWFLPRLMFRESYVAEVRLKIRYLSMFRDNVLYPFDQEVVTDIKAAGENIDRDELMKYFNFLITRITLLQERVGGKQPLSVEKFIGISSALLCEKHPDIPPETAAMLGNNYQYYLTWNENTAEFEAQIEKFRGILEEMLGNDTNIKDIIFESIPVEPDVTLNTFWENLKSDNENEQVFVSGIFTNNTQQQIELFFKVLESSVINQTRIQDEKKKFWQWYQSQFYEAWRDFTQQFSQDISNMETGSNPHHMATVMTTDQNPYFILLERMASEFSKVNVIDKEPPWVEFVQRMDDIRKQALVEKEKQKGTLLGKIESKKETLIQSTLGKVDKKRSMDAELLQRMGTIWGEYTDALQAISPSLGSRERCFQILSEFNMSPFALAESKYTQLQNLLQNENEFPVVWNLVLGPEQFLVAYCAQETSFVLQEQWEEQVLGGITGISDEKLPLLLFDKNQGIVWKYLDTSGKSFISRNNDGYYVRKRFENLIRFRSDFFAFLNNGTDTIANYQPVYYVNMETLPLDVNSEAKEAPYGSIITLQSSDGNIALNNYNYPQKQTFAWSSEKCGDVTVNILLQNTTLTKTYDGKMGFPKFLRDFRSGNCTFKTGEFPDYADQLQKTGITWIRLAYKITGATPVIELLNKSVTEVPKQIIVTNQ